MVKMTKTADKTAATQTRGNYFRLDPYSVPDRIAFSHKDIHYTLDRTGVSVKMKLPKSGLPLSFALPARSFKGVAAKAVLHDDGRQTVSLELHHEDPELCIPVLVANDLEHIAADWHSWSRLMRLPMLMIDTDGMPQPVQNELGNVMVEDPIARRKRISAYKPRSWFLRRRKVGQIGEIKKITAEEIIARV